MESLVQARPLVRESRPRVASVHDLARYLVAEYLMDWGLRDPDVTAAESRRIVEEAARLTLDVEAVNLERELCETAIRLTMEEVEAAIAGMATSSSRNRLPGAPTSNSIVPRIASVFLEFPDAIRHRDRPPAQLLAVLERSISPIVPEAQPRAMRPQPSTRLCCVLRRGYWRCVSRRVSSWWRGRQWGTGR